MRQKGWHVEKGVDSTPTTEAQQGCQHDIAAQDENPLSTTYRTVCSIIVVQEVQTTLSSNVVPDEASWREPSAGQPTATSTSSTCDVSSRITHGGSYVTGFSGSDSRVFQPFESATRHDRPEARPQGIPAYFTHTLLD